MQRLNEILTTPQQRGQGLTEYIILLMLIAVASIVAVRSLGNTVREKIQDARAKIDGMRIE